MAAYATSTATTTDFGGAAGGGSHNVAVPTGLSAGDAWIIFALLDCDPGGAISLPSGWTAIGSQIIGSPGYPVLRAFGKIASGGEAAQPVAFTGAGYIFWCASIRITDVNQTTPFGTPATVSSVGNVTVLDAPDITVHEDNNVAILLLGYEGDSTSSTTAPAGATRIQNIEGPWPGGAVAYQAVNAGAYSPGNWSITRSDSDNLNGHAITFEVRNAASGGGGGGGATRGQIPPSGPGIGPDYMKMFRPAQRGFRVGQTVYTDSIAEFGSASDAFNASGVLIAAMAESGSAGDALSSVRVAGATLSEAGSAGDTLSSVFTAIVSLSESGSSTDVVSTIGTLLAQLTESGTASDAVDGAIGAVAHSVALSESGSAADLVSALLQAVATLSETSTASGSVSASTSGNTYSVSVVEAAGAGDSVTNALVAARSLAESGNAGDAVSALMSALAQLQETGAASDVQVSTWTGLRSLSEVVTAIDSISIDTGAPKIGTRIVVVRAQSRTIRVSAPSRTVH